MAEIHIKDNTTKLVGEPEELFTMLSMGLCRLFENINAPKAMKIKLLEEIASIAYNSIVSDEEDECEECEQVNTNKKKKNGKKTFKLLSIDM